MQVLKDTNLNRWFWRPELYHWTKNPSYTVKSTQSRYHNSHLQVCNQCGRTWSRTTEWSRLIVHRNCRYAILPVLCLSRVSHCSKRFIFTFQNSLLPCLRTKHSNWSDPYQHTLSSTKSVKLSQCLFHCVNPMVSRDFWET